MRAALFPGQGSQAVGMGRALYEGSAAAREVLERAEAVLPGLLELMFEGPEETLTLTENAQPALLAVGYAAYAAYREAGGPEPAAAAGHSLGEWTAHVAAGTLALEDALRLVRLRGRYMQEAVPVGEGAMAAVLKLPLDAIEEALRGLEGVWVANLNTPAQTVISGRREAVEEAARRLKEKRARVVFLNVSAPFHTPLMAPAAEKLAGEVAAVSFRDPAFPVYANVTARPVTQGEEARRLLIEQITAPVRWVEVTQALYAAGVRTFLEFGVGNVLTGMVRRILEGVRAQPVTAPEEAREVAEWACRRPRW